MLGTHNYDMWTAHMCLCSCSGDNGLYYSNSAEKQDYLFFKKMSGYGIRWVTHSFKCSMGDRLSSTRLPIFQEFISLTLKT